MEVRVYKFHVYTSIGYQTVDQLTVIVHAVRNHVFICPLKRP